MSQRNPMNERYTAEDRQGKTRKSAAAAKPKTKAAASVRVQAVQKTKEQKKVEQKAQRQKQSELDRKYYNPPTAEYKRLRKIWWACLIGAIACTAFSWFARSLQPEFLSYIGLGGAYILIIVAFYIDFSKIRKVRRKYQEEMMAKKTKEMRAAEKQQKAARLQAAKVALPAEEPAKKIGLFGTGVGPDVPLPKFGMKKKAKVAEASDEQDASAHSAQGGESGQPAKGAASQENSGASANRFFEAAKAKADADASAAEEAAKH